MQSKQPILLLVLDGWGLAPPGSGNAVSLAKMPYVQFLKKKYPWVAAQASGTAVGLPDQQMGNSEVGHRHLGAGRICTESLVLINKVMTNKKLSIMSTWKKSIAWIQQHQQRVHLVGLCSDGGVHSDLQHLFTMTRLLVAVQIKNIFFHLIADGRDTAPQVFLRYYNQLIQLINELGVGQVVTVSGRYYAMDRDHRFERTEQAYQAMTMGLGVQIDNMTDYVQQQYLQGITDEFLIPGVVASHKNGLIKPDDTIIFFNFRSDRAVQLSAFFSNPDYQYQPVSRVQDLTLITCTDYGSQVKPKYVLFAPAINTNCLGVWISKHHYRQLRVAETEKIAHVTYFFDGGEDFFRNGMAIPSEITLPRADKILIPSPQVATYDLAPEMSCRAITKAVVRALEQQKYDFILVNFANPDMVGHTGVIPATIHGLQAVDQCIEQLHTVVEKTGGVMVITADHGNAEKMLNGTEVNKKHTNNLVPIIITDQKYQLQDTPAAINQVAPTLLDIWGLPAPPEMTTSSLIVSRKS